MSPPYDAKSIANLFLRKAIADSTPIDPMKLQKLIYFTHGYYMALHKKRDGFVVPLVDEFFEAWRFGPVLPSIYHEFKNYGADKITSLALEYRPEFRAEVVAVPPIDDKRLNHIANFVWETYAKRHSLALSDLTHKEGGAWDKARKQAPGIKNKDIPNEDIVDDFLPLIKG